MYDKSILGDFVTIKNDEIIIENMIYEIRGKQVMLDSDLARLYECANGTKTINQAVNRHLDRFPSDFCFQLTDKEYSYLWSQVGTANLSNMSRTKPYVFTEQGVAMLATVLRTKIASLMSISIMRAFVSMRHYIGNNEYRLSNIEAKIIEHDSNIKLLQESFNKLEEKKKINEIYFEGQIYDAYSKIQDIFKSCTKKLIIIDSYADKILLDIIKKLDIEVILITRSNSLLTSENIKRYNKQYNNLSIIYDNTFHDRYFILDMLEVYHCGTSVNRIGYKTFSINIISDKEVCDLLINKVSEIGSNNSQFKVRDNIYEFQN